MNSEVDLTALNLRPEPAFAIGEWAYNEHKGHNARIVAIEWDKFTGRWYYWMPGLGQPYPCPERHGRPYHHYELTNRNCYEDRGPVARDTGA